MILPEELYLHIFTLADNLDTTKALRCVSKIAWSASYDYFKILLRKPIIMNFGPEYCNISDSIDCKNCKRIGCLKIPDHCYCPLLPTVKNCIAFEISIKDLFNTLK
jgi:hypothetical protein